MLMKREGSNRRWVIVPHTADMAQSYDDNSWLYDSVTLLKFMFILLEQKSSMGSFF